MTGRAVSMIRRLSSAFRKDTESNNHKILKIKAEELDEAAGVIDDIIRAHNLNLSNGQSLDYLAELLELERTGLSDDDFRVLIAATAVFRRSNGTVADLKNAVSSITGIPVDDIVVHEDGNTSFSIEMLSPNRKAFSLEILADNIENAKAAGVKFLADETSMELTLIVEEDVTDFAGMIAMACSEHTAGTCECGEDLYGNPCEVHSTGGILTPII